MELANSFLELDQKGVSNMKRIIHKFIYPGFWTPDYTVDKASTRIYQTIVPMLKSISVKTNLITSNSTRHAFVLQSFQF